ncbi:MAG: 23S rRNA (adenine(2503)-C(2))-methyltransferase RlmN [Anaerolineales bacterium]|nr:MAG: 23S rRNA (adenine(2503)-C(2))-methyltransferase RlmN [Anaerolineales bacterium]
MPRAGRRNALNERPLFYDLTPEDLTQRMLTWGEPAYRGRQLWRGVYRQLAGRPKAITNLPHNLQRRLSEAFSFCSMEVKTTVRSTDNNTQKVLLSLTDGQSIEVVLMRYERRRTVCISTQVGCALGCVFCATGQMGFVRDLTAGEIVEQVIYFARKLARNGERLTNIVVMGMGEPFLNYQATIQAIDTLNNPDGFNFGARRFTISTIGLTPMIERFTQERRQVNLAVSLHAATDELRQQLLPINRRYPLESLIPACRNYVEQTGRRITFEWALIRQVNDGLDQAEALADLIQGLNCHINIIPLNPTNGYAGETTPQQQVKNFYHYLTGRKIHCTIRMRRGISINAGCGQLVTERKADTKPSIV